MSLRKYFGFNDLPFKRQHSNTQRIRPQRPVSLFSVVSKAFENFVNNRIVDHLKKCGLFSDFQSGFRSSRSTADLLGAFSRLGATRAVAFDISKAFDISGQASFISMVFSCLCCCHSS